MGLFDLFKKKKPKNTFPENELEKTLKKAFEDSSAIGDFYMKLLWNDLIIITDGQNEENVGTQTLTENTTIRFLTFDTGQIPIFTSGNRIYDKGIVKDEMPIVAMKGQDLFEVAKGATFILNPYSDYGKELSPKEVESILNGSIFEKSNDNDVGLDENQVEQFNQLFESACNRQEKLIHLDGYHVKSLSTTDKEKLYKSIEEFQGCLAIFPEHWQSMTLMAKSYQRLGQHEKALELLEKAFLIETENTTIPMEASLNAMHLEDIDKAIFYSEESLKRKPNDVALLGNHAMNLLVACKDDEAKRIIQQAMKLDPADPINKNVKSVIDGVLSGKRKRPTFKDAVR